MVEFPDAPSFQEPLTMELSLHIDPVKLHAPGTFQVHQKLRQLPLRVAVVDLPARWLCQDQNVTEVQYHQRRLALRPNMAGLHAINGGFNGKIMGKYGKFISWENHEYFPADFASIHV